jgi:hypothetical protein
VPWRAAPWSKNDNDDNNNNNDDDDDDAVRSTLKFSLASSMLRLLVPPATHVDNVAGNIHSLFAFCCD